ncbi:MAG: 1,4-alpha-glucan branching protein GlgB [Thermodesulfovibrionales bacterium]|nr:1,4-alpha-glucan branching protein GlgB [Thermodesulfovibrionales bacterium]
MVRYDISLLTEYDIYIFKQGKHYKLYEKLGSHILNADGIEGTYFAVWAPNASRVSVIGDFNNWNPDSHPLTFREDLSGIWEGFIPGIKKGTLYKYHIVSKFSGYRVDKADPFAFFCENMPGRSSIVWDLDFYWQDEEWMSKRYIKNSLSSPMSIYEVHIGSWKRVPEQDNRYLSYRELAPQLAEYANYMGFTHIEFLPIMEHPFYGSWGYQTTGYFAPTSRYGCPQDLMWLIDYLHRNGIGVIFDWVPSHFPDDIYGLVYFDGTHLFEHEDPRKGFHPDWNSYIFNYGRNEVKSFLISNALFWFDKYHIDGIRIDAVASMLYLDYSRKEGQWIPNKYGGKENLEAIDFLKELNLTIYQNYPDIQTIAEESTSWPLVSRPLYLGGLGFGLKWNMGWMHDTLDYFSSDPIYRKYNHQKITFSIWYAFYENFILTLSHDEVVYGKGSLLGKMPGDDWAKKANLKLLLGYMYAHPGKKLLFMGGEFGQYNEWNHESSIDWHLLQYPSHRGILNWVRDLNHLYRNEPALYEIDFLPKGFQWIDFKDSEQSIISFLRRDSNFNEVIVICNMTPVPRFDYRIGVPKEGVWQEILNSDADYYGGKGYGNFGKVKTEKIPFHGFNFSLSLTLPPLAVLYLKWQEQL